jgi:L-asparaginase II
MPSLLSYDNRTAPRANAVKLPRDDGPVSDTSPAPAAPVLAQVVRSGRVEGRHRGALVITDALGSVLSATGDVTGPVYPRSSLKLMQASAVLRAGAPLEGPLLALAAASHSGEKFHVDGVLQILHRAGLPVDALQCPPGVPLDPQEHAARLRAGDTTDARLLMNCSGKHAAMLLACVTAGWPTDTYLEPSHPLQQLIAAEIADAAGEPVAHTGVDGCGAPAGMISLTGLAAAFRSFALAEPASPRGRVAAAMRAHPAYVAGTRRSDTWLMAAIPGTLAKVGAEGVQGLALADGRTLALKIDDGAARAVGPVVVQALRGLGIDAPVLDRLLDEGLLHGGGGVVGAIEAV